MPVIVTCSCGVKVRLPEERLGQLLRRPLLEPAVERDGLRVTTTLDRSSDPSARGQPKMQYELISRRRAQVIVVNGLKARHRNSASPEPP